MTSSDSLSIDRDLKIRILADIAAHIRVYGRERWELVRDRPEYAHLIGREAGPSGKRKFFRWANSVSLPLEPDRTRPHEAREIATQAISEGAKRARLAATKNIPYPPSPAYMAKAGAEGDRMISFLSEIWLLMEDAHTLREAALDENGAIDDERAFTSSITARLRIISQGASAWRDIYDLKDQVQFYDLLVEVLVEELEPVPEIQKRVIQRFEELNARRGMTIFAPTE